MSARPRNPAVLVNCYLTGMGMLQSLALADVDIVTVERNDWMGRYRPLMWIGRYSRIPKFKMTYRPRHGEALVPSLMDVTRHFDGKAVLFIADDDDLEEVLDHYDTLAERYHLPVSREIGHRIFDKNWQYEIAERVHHPLPPYVCFVGGEQPPLEHLGFPLIIKPSSRAAAAGARVFRLRLIRDALELERCLQFLARNYAGRAFQAAEIIPGGPDHLYTVGAYSNRDGRVLRSYTGRKLTQFPYDHGSVSVAESLSLPSEVVDKAEALLNEGRIPGITQVELKLDARDGRFKLIEINDRGWFWVKLAAYSGVNLPLMQYYDLTEDPRLSAVLAEPQRNDRFFVLDFHVKMNNLESERQLIEELRRKKELIPAIYQQGEWMLNSAYWLSSLLRRTKRRIVGQPPREQQFVTADE